MQVYFKSEPTVIGEHEWRILVMDNGLHLGKVEVFGRERVVRYQWRSASNGALWNMDRNWPTYNSDHDHSGLPADLARLNEINITAIKEALGQESDRDDDIMGVAQGTDQMDLL